ncbi:hypothetical protein [Haloferula sp. BvORR071]|uniref:hypothetical protein n=1 Tax=Haloferula sp. BvORR071 TaxID=1396141 RepID=UPI002240F718|nr:hypothetical protein [Haloferula sp. BvORR071]
MPSLPYNRPRWWRSPFLLLALLGGISLGWLWWESSHQGRGIGWTSAGRRYFVSHGAGWLYFGATNGDRVSSSKPEPWIWEQTMKGDHLRWLPPLDVKVTRGDDHELRRLAFTYWFLISGYLGFCGGLGIWWQRRGVAACRVELPDETSERYDSP